MEDLKNYVRDQIFELEPKLLRAFPDYNSSSNLRFRKLEADVSNIDAAGTQRVGLIESKVTDLEIRMIKLEMKPQAPPPPCEPQ